MNKEVKDLLINKMTIIKQEQQKDICLVGPIQLPVQLGNNVVHFQWYSWLKLDDSLKKEDLLNSLPHMNLTEMQQSSVLVFGDFQNANRTLIRMHSICHTGDIFGSKRCDCGYQLRESMRMIIENGSGALFYLANHEGRGIGLFSKSLAYLLQQEGFDTVEANVALGFDDDIRSYDEAIRVLGSLRQKPVTLITNNPKKLYALKLHGLTVEDHVPLWGDISNYNSKYLQTKVEKSGHISAESKIVSI